MRNYLILCSLLILNSCLKPSKKTGLTPDPIYTEALLVKPSLNSKMFAFDDFLIQKGKLGSIFIGMTVPQAEQYLVGLMKMQVSSLDFGIDGDSEAYMYSKGEKPVLALIPAMLSDTILYIAAIHKDLKTINGLSAKAKVQDLLKVYPDMNVVVNQIALWEFMYDAHNQWEFVFMTDEHNWIGKYEEGVETSKPFRQDISSDWVLIR